MNGIKRLIILCIVAIFSIPVHCYAAEITDADAGFKELLNSNNVSVRGSDVTMTESQIEGFVNMFNTNDAKKEFTNKLSKEETDITVSSKDILEMHYYSLKQDEREKFLSKIKNQIVDVNANKGIILISYDANDTNNGDIKLMSTTNTYTSTREATIKMQDEVTGNWGQVDAKLTGHFKKITYTNSWKVYEDDYDISTDDTSPCGSIISYVTGTGSAVTSSSKYKGNEVHYEACIQAICGFNTSNL